MSIDKSNPAVLEYMQSKIYDSPMFERIKSVKASVSFRITARGIFGNEESRVMSRDELIERFFLLPSCDIEELPDG